MNRDEHPEDLIDRALVGDLGKAQRAELNEHLAVCAACATHVALASRLRIGTSTSGEEGLNRLAIASALARARAPQVRVRWRLGWSGWRWAVAGIPLVAGLAAAAVMFHEPTANVLQTSDPMSPRPGTKVTMGGAAVAEPSASPTATSDSSAADAPVTAPAERRSIAKAGSSAAALFARAGELRRQGRVDQALDTYRRLQQRYPRTREAGLSFALAGRLLLDQGRPAQALAEFDHYMTVGQHGGVAEEALAGRAIALGQLGRIREEKADWQSLLERFPESIYAAQARARLTK